MRKVSPLFPFSIALLLAACGGDSGSSSKPEENSSGITTVATYEDLAHCTKSHYGEIAYVEEENTYFECTSDDWTEVDSAKVDDILAASSSSVAADSSKPKSSSSLAVSEKDTATVEVKKVDSVSVSGFAHKGPFVKGSSVTVYGLDSLFKKTKTKFTGTVENDSGAFKVTKVVLPSQFALIEVSGYYQNEISGKNTSGSKTTLLALVDLSAGKSVTANVNLFTDMEYARARHLILNEKFNVMAAKKRATKELLSLFDADKVGEPAEPSEDLTATSLSLFDTTKAGKTLFIASLLMQGDLSASKFGTFLGTAEELFATTGTLDSDELLASIADWASKVDSTDGFAQIRANVNNLKLMTTVPDFESALYAYWTKEYGLGSCTDSLESVIKKNENKLSNNYGKGYACTAKHWHKATVLDTDLGLCTGNMEGQFKERKGQKNAEYYVCKAGSWKEINETQYELKECTDTRNNEYKAAKSGEYFVCSNKLWIEIDNVTYELKLCTESRKYELGKTEKLGGYVCRYDGKVGKWENATDVEMELGVCGGKGVKADSIYKTKENEYYLCKVDKWTEAEKLAYELQSAGTCTEEKNLTTFETKTLGLFVCDNKAWRKATDVESEFGVCGKDVSELTVKKSKGGKVYACKNGAWSVVEDALIAELGFCTAEMADSIYKTADGSYVKCGKQKWEASTLLAYEIQELGECTEKRNLELAATKTQGNYVCESKAWRKATSLEDDLGVCGSKANPDSSIRKASGYNDSFYSYVCIDGNWTLKTYSYDVGLCTEKLVDSVRVCTSKTGYCVCNSDLSWSEIQMEASLFGRCTKALKDSVRWSGSFKEESIIADMESEGQFYACNGTQWNKSKGTKYVYGNTCTDGEFRMVVDSLTSVRFFGNYLNGEGQKVVFMNRERQKELTPMLVDDGDTLYYVTCKSSDWKKVSSIDYRLEDVCTVSRDTIKDGFACQDGAWRVATAAEKATGFVCRDFNNYVGQQKVYSGYVCDATDGTYEWRKADDIEKELGHTCHVKIANTFDSTTSTTYVCEKSNGRYVWRIPNSTEVEYGMPCNGSRYKLFVWPYYNDDEQEYRGFRCTDSTTHQYLKASNVYETFVDDRGDAFNVFSYKTVDIGNRVWFVENLKYKDGETCNSGCQKNGYSFSQPGSNDKFCPDGWRDANNEDWESLKDRVSFGLDNLAALPAYDSDNRYGLSLKTNSCYWVRVKDMSNINQVATVSSTGKVSISDANKNDKCYVRCVKDKKN